MIPATMLLAYKPPSSQPTNRPAVAANLQGASALSTVATNFGSMTLDHYCIVLVHTTRNGAAADSVVSVTDTLGTSYSQLAAVENTAVSTAQHRVEIWGGKIPASGSNAVTVGLSGGNGAHLVQATSFSNVNTTQPLAGSVSTQRNNTTGSAAANFNMSSAYDNSLAVVITADIGNFIAVNGSGWTLFSNVQSGTPAASSTWWTHTLDSSASVAVSSDSLPNWICVGVPLKGT